MILSPCPTYSSNNPSCIARPIGVISGDRPEDGDCHSICIALVEPSSAPRSKESVTWHRRRPGVNCGNCVGEDPAANDQVRPRVPDDFAADDRGPWEALTVDQVATRLAAAPFPWWIAGGWAIDLFVGHQTRPHDDIDIVVLRRDQRAVQEAMADWELWAADPPGSLRPWSPGESL